MNDLRKAAEMALEAFEVLDRRGGLGLDVHEYLRTKIDALRQALAQPEQKQKTPLKVLNLTVFTENRLRNGRVYDVETLQAMTNRDILAIPDMGKKALAEVLEALNVHAVNMSQECVDETAKCEWVGITEDEAKELYEYSATEWQFVQAIEAKLKEKNNG